MSVAEVSLHIRFIGQTDEYFIREHVDSANPHLLRDVIHRMGYRVQDELLLEKTFTLEKAIDKVKRAGYKVLDGELK